MLRGGGQDTNLLLGAVSQRLGGIEVLLDGQLTAVAVGGHDLLVGLALDVGRVDDLGAAQGGQDLLLQLLEYRSHVLDLLLTLGGRVVAAQHLENDVLVLDVGLLDQLLEAFPVLTVGCGVDLQTGLLEQLGYDLLARLAAGLRELVVELLRTVGRSVALHGDVLRGALVREVGVHVLLEGAQVGVLLVGLRHARRVDRVEQLGLVDLGGYLLVVVGHILHQVAVLEVLLERVHAVGDRQTELAGESGLGLGIVTGQHGSLLLGRNGTRVEVHERELLALARRALDLGT